MTNFSKNVLTFCLQLRDCVFVCVCVCVRVCKGSICAYMMLYVAYTLLWYAKWLLSVKNCFHLLTPAQGGCKNILCACMVLYAPFKLIWYATWLLSEKMLWPLTPPQGSSVCVRTEYVLACCCFRHSHTFWPRPLESCTMRKPSNGCQIAVRPPKWVKYCHQE